MKDTKRPGAPDKSDRPSARDLTTFGAALLASIGLGSLVTFLRKRAARKHEEQQQERDTRRQAELRGQIAELRRMKHEGDDMRVGRIVFVAVAMIVSGGVVLLALAGLFAFLANRETQADASVPPLAQTPQLPPEPRLEVAPAENLARLRATEQAQLNSYGWVDQNAGVVHIPIDRAMALVAQRGVPTRVAGTPGPGVTSEPTSVPGAGQNVSAATAAPQPVGTPAPAGTADGQQLFTSLGCAGCHLMNGSGVGPSLRGVFGSQVQLEGGGSVTADEAYIRESILNPNAKIVAGHQPDMPSFAGRLSDQQLAALVAYIKSLGQ